MLQLCGSNFERTRQYMQDDSTSGTDNKLPQSNQLKLVSLGAKKCLSVNDPHKLVSVLRRRVVLRYVIPPDKSVDDMYDQA